MTQETKGDESQPNAPEPIETSPTKKEEPLELIDVPIKDELNPAVRRFIVVNNTTDNYFVSFNLVPKSPNFLNFRLVLSMIQVAVKAGQSATILTIAKIFPEVEWGEYDLNCGVQKIEAGNRIVESPSNQIPCRHFAAPLVVSPPPLMISLVAYYVVDNKLLLYQARM